MPHNNEYNGYPAGGMNPQPDQPRVVRRDGMTIQQPVGYRPGQEETNFGYQRTGPYQAPYDEEFDDDYAPEYEAEYDEEYDDEYAEEYEDEYGGDGYADPGMPQGGFAPQQSGPYEPVQSIDEDPFQDDGVDPSLEELRATAVLQRKGRFWMDFHKAQKMRAREERRARRIAERAGGHAGRKALLTAGVVAVVLFVLGSALYRVRNIEVIGTLHTFSESDVIALSGLKPWMSMADVDAKNVTAAVQSNRYLICRGVETEGLDKVTIRVKERVPVAVLDSIGTRYLLDHRCMVLEESPPAEKMDGLPVITGVSVKGNYGCVVGSYLKTEATAQLETLRELLLELTVQQFTGEIKNINVSNMENILMETRDRYGVLVGDGTYLHGKIKAMRLVRQELIAQGDRKGTIDVSNRTTPTFMPD